jgi:TetR/AcrR family transcriptional repressor of nem operon
LNRPVYLLFLHMPGTTKKRILAAAEEIMLTKSFHSVGLTEILAAVKVPKGSFYHHFSSKEQFGVELISHYVREHTARLRKFFAAPDTNALQKLVDYWGYQIGHVTESGCQQCCLVVKLGLEVASFSEPMREVLADGLKTWRAIYEQVVREGQADGSMRRELKPAEAAAAIQDTWQGAMQRMQVERSVAPLRSAAQFLRASLAPA